MSDYKEYNVRVYSYQTEWYLNGKIHREDGPAVEYADGSELWYRYGVLHREDGPARIYYLNEEISPSKMYYYSKPKFNSIDETKLKIEEYWLNGRNVFKESVLLLI